MSAAAVFKPEHPLIVQGDHTILAEVASPYYAAARDGLSRFAELVKAPEHVHTYRVTPLSIWNACASGVTAGEMAGTLVEFSKYPVPEHVLFEIRDYASRYGRVKLLRDGRGLVLAANEEPLAEQIARSKHVAPFLGPRWSALEFAVAPAARGEIKQALIKIGFPAEDLAGYNDGEALALALRERTLSGQPFALRPYQQEAAAAFHAAGAARGGSGVITLPCGAGKTIVAMACMERLQTSTLVLTTSVTAVRQGMTAKNVLEILERVCTREVPGNVRREIQGWFAQCRKVAFESALLIRCPDCETAWRIVGLAKGSAVALNETILEYKDPGKQRPWLIKKLKEMGVLVSVQEAAKPAPAQRARRRWGRW